MKGGDSNCPTDVSRNASILGVPPVSYLLPLGDLRTNLIYNFVAKSHKPQLIELLCTGHIPTSTELKVAEQVKYLEMATGYINPRCKVCNKLVEIFQDNEGDNLEFSVSLHMKQHEPLEKVNRDVLRLESQVELNNKSKSNSYITCGYCEEKIEIINNNLAFTLQLHDQGCHVARNTTSFSDEPKHIKPEPPKKVNASQKCSNAKVKSCDKNVGEFKSETKTCKLSTTLDIFFNSNSMHFMSHRSYISEESSSKVTCSICNNYRLKLTELKNHLKRKQHMDNVILSLKNALPHHLNHVTKFITFQGCNIFCSVCRNIIPLNSANVHETIINIVVHNETSTHLKKSKESAEDCPKILKMLAGSSEIIRENMVFIKGKSETKFKCSLCKRSIRDYRREEELLKNFHTHFNSQGHRKMVKAALLLKDFIESTPFERNYHNFKLQKQKAYCRICKCYIKVKNDELKLHVVGESEGIASNCIGNSSATISTKKETFTNSVSFRDLIKSLPQEFHNVKYIVENIEMSVTCLICNCVMPRCAVNVTHHLLGRTHRKKETIQGQFGFHQIYNLMETKGMSAGGGLNSPIMRKLFLDLFEQAFGMLPVSVKVFAIFCFFFICMVLANYIGYFMSIMISPYIWALTKCITVFMILCPLSIFKLT